MRFLIPLLLLLWPVLYHTGIVSAKYILRRNPGFSMDGESPKRFDDDTDMKDDSWSKRVNLRYFHEKQEKRLKIPAIQRITYKITPLDEMPRYDA
ncbi:hypothetical protein COOONC_25882 [Cooperia oncophora]